MGDSKKWEPAHEPEDLARLFLERAKARDIDGLVALYERDAVLAGPGGQLMVGHAAIRQFYASMFAEPRTFVATDQRPALRRGDLALTSSRLANGRVTVEVAHQQPDGSWLWAIDQPHIAKENA